MAPLVVTDGRWKSAGGGTWVCVEDCGNAQSGTFMPGGGGGGSKDCASAGEKEIAVNAASKTIRMIPPSRSSWRPVCATVPPIRSELNDRANAFAGMHQIERLIDAIQGKLVRDQGIDTDLAVHVPVHDLGHLCAAPRPAKGGALPHPARDQLERPRLDLLARARDPDDDAFAPAAM